MDILERVIDRDAAVRTLQRFLFGPDDRLQTLDAAALVHLSCGHVRPVNAWFEPGDSLSCLVCGPATVVDLELLPETVEYPAPDAFYVLDDEVIS